MADSSATQIYLIFAIGTTGMLIMAIAIIMFVVFYQKRMLREQLKRQVLEADYQKRMLQAALESQENERRRLAADLHDSVGAMLSAIRVGLSTMIRKDEMPSENILQTKQMLDDTIETVRAISRDLMPSTLEKFGLIQAIKEMCERFSATSKVPIFFHDDGSDLSLNKNQEIMIFRIVQEMLNNVLKHAQALQIKVEVQYNGELSIAVEDNGVGFDPDAIKNSSLNGKGLGLFNMENRARLLGGRMEYEKHRETGSKVSLLMPISHERKDKNLHR